MPKRDLQEIMQDKSDRMAQLLGVKKKVDPVVAPVKKTLKGDNPYRVLGLDAAQTDVIVRAARVLDPKFDATKGPKPLLIGTGNKRVNWRVGPVEHHALRLFGAARSMQALPEGCPDPNHLARVVLQQWYAQWGPAIEEATGIKPEGGSGG